MTLRKATRIIVLLLGTKAFAQNTLPGTTASAPILNQRPGLPGRRGPVANKNNDLQGLIALHQQVEDMEGVLPQMHVTLKQMQAKSAKSKTTDPLTKANLDMWELMVGHLDQELEQMRGELAQREDMEVRRAALYKQADAKAEAEARAAMAGKLAGQSTAAATAGQAAPATPATPTPAALTPSSPAATPAPASPATSPN